MSIKYDADTYQLERAAHNRGHVEPTDAMIIYTLGLNGEAGEVADLFKKHIAHGRTLDRTELLHELGDVLWYLSQIAHVNGITMSEIMKANTDKIRARHPEGFTVTKGEVRP